MNQRAELPLVIHLLHGTWASGAPWTKPGSSLFTALEKEFGPPLSISWRGRNRDVDRRSAAEEVITKLQNQDGRHVLIAHSHGGNIALYAGGDQRLRGKVAGIVCLNTPCISITRRDYTTRLAVFAFLAVVGPVMWAAGDLISKSDGLLLDGLILLGAVVVMCLSLASCIPLLRLLHKQGQTVWRRLAPTRVPDTPVLCIATGDDEAEYGLSALDHLANVAPVLMHPLIMIGMIFVSIAMQVAGLLPELSFFGFNPGRVYGAFTYVLATFIALQLVAMAFSFFVTRIALGLSFGYWPLLFNFFVRVRVTPTPLYYRRVDYVDFVVPVGDGLSNLAHSRIYEDENVIRQIVLWLKNGFTVEPPAASQRRDDHRS